MRGCLRPIVNHLWVVRSMCPELCSLLTFRAVSCTIGYGRGLQNVSLDNCCEAFIYLSAVSTMAVVVPLLAFLMLVLLLCFSVLVVFLSFV